MKTIVRTLRNVSVATLTVCCLCFLFFNGNIQPNFVVAQNQDDAQMLAVLTPADAQKIMAAEEVQTTVAEAKPIRDRNRNLERNRDRNQDRNRDQIRRRAASGVNIEQPTVPGIEIISQPINPPAPWIASQPITPPALTQEQLEAISIQPAVIFKETGSRVVPAMLPLFKEESITYNVKDEYPRKNSVLKYRLHVPENMEKGKKYPLILWLHGAGEVGDDNKLQLVHLHHIITYLTGEKKRDFFLLVPQAPRNHASWDAGSYSQVLPKELTDTLSQNEIIEQYKSASEPRSTISLTKMDDETVLTISRPVDDSPLGYSFAMLDQVMKNYPVDKDRITVSGLSTGGDGTWRALERRPELFAAAVPLVSWDALTDGALSQSPVLKKIPIWAIYSSDDNGIDQARTDFERVEKAGCNVKKSEFGICGHNAWTPAMLQADIFSWLLSRGKKDGEYVSVVDANVNPDELKGIVEVATRDTRKPKLAPAPPQVVQKTENETDKKAATAAIAKSDTSAKKPTVTALYTPTQSPPPSLTPTTPADAQRQQHREELQKFMQQQKQEMQKLHQQYREKQQQLRQEYMSNVQKMRSVVIANIGSGVEVKLIEVPVEDGVVLSKEEDELYAQLAIRFFHSGDDKQSLNEFYRNFVKLTPTTQKNILKNLLKSSPTKDGLLLLEKLLYEMSQNSAETTPPVNVNVPAVPIENKVEKKVVPVSAIPVTSVKPIEVPAEKKVVYSKEYDKFYAELAKVFLYSSHAQALDGFSRNFAKLSPEKQKEFWYDALLIADEVKTDEVKFRYFLLLEKLLDKMSQNSVKKTSPVISPHLTMRKVDGEPNIKSAMAPTPAMPPTPAAPPTPTAPPTSVAQLFPTTPMPTQTTTLIPPSDSQPVSAPLNARVIKQEEEEEYTSTPVSEKIIEDCDRPWAMTSESLYGMFPADWDKEGKKIPQFIVELDSDKLAKKLAASVSGDGQDFKAACQSIIALENKPMSSPWFETGGGRLRSDIRYTLSAKGQMFTRLLKAVKDSTGTPEKTTRAKLAQKTLEKIELILGNLE